MSAIPYSRNLSELIDGGADLAAATPSGKTALHNAAHGGFLTAVRLLLSGGSEIDALDEKGWTPLFWAACYGREEVVALLLASGADVRVQVSDRCSALHIASKFGSVMCVRLLLRAGSDPGMRSAGGGTPLHMAAGRGDVAIVRVLLEVSDVNALTHDQWTPLACAAVKGRAEVVGALLGAGADPTRDRPLHRAVRSGSAEVVRSLLAAGVSPDVRDSDGSTPAMVADDTCVEALGELIRSGCDLSLRDPGGYTALQRAARMGQARTARMLVEAGADPLSYTLAGETALGLALANGHAVVVREFIALGFDPNALGGAHTSPVVHGRRLDVERQSLRSCSS
jgi:ankyrin repeat protein